VTVYPTRRAILLMAAGAPVALAVSLAEPHLWVAAGAWAILVVGLMLADLLLAPRAGSMDLTLSAPQVMGVGRQAAAPLTATFHSGGPRDLELALGADARLEVRPGAASVRVRDGKAEARFTLMPTRRGPGHVDRIWARWQGPLGLIWRQRESRETHAIAITPDIQSARDEALRLFSRDAPLGTKAQLDRGEGSDFHALKEFQTGMDLRSIDWKQSARHGKLVGREYRSERNHPVMLAIDSGRLMSAPFAGAPRLDHAVNAALLLAFVSLKLGDRVGLFAFDARPRVASGVAAGPGAFPLLQRLAADIDYSVEETNFTLGLTSLAGKLDRRSLVVVFTDFADPTSAELMVESVGRLMRTHQVLFVVFRDEELERFAEAEPCEPDDVSRAVVSAALLRQREVVVARLRRLGAQIIDAPARQLGPALVNAYLDVKRRELV